ncbi:MAG: tRNA (adenosine(37)-N6)-dimethylallyltransferase MiaA [Candidatus Babeliaceae bacterium]|nr:tRNA (adenosine(37)-N6)-dimethylallyltransferase MiaA [Candidatus Babeliaceae bacterium]
MRKIIIIAGPTGVGKSDFAELLAEKINGEIVNADQGQFYEPLSIGTAKPDWKNKTITHHLFDLVKETRNYNNVEYQKAARACIADIHARGKRAIIVGGSGFYYQMLLFEFTQLPETLPIPSRQDPVRTWDELYKVDPVRAKAIHPHDQYRINRALEIFYSYNVLPSSFGLVYKPSFSYHFLHINRNIEELYERINKRSVLMLAEGWLEETRSLTAEWKNFVKLKKTIGYADILNYQDGSIDYETLVKNIQQKTRNYAKRQRTYFKTLLKKIPINDHWCIQEINLTLLPVDLYLNQLNKLLN